MTQKIIFLQSRCRFGWAWSCVLFFLAKSASMSILVTPLHYHSRVLIVLRPVQVVVFIKKSSLQKKEYKFLRLRWSFDWAWACNFATVFSARSTCCKTPEGKTVLFIWKVVAFYGLRVYAIQIDFFKRLLDSSRTGKRKGGVISLMTICVRWMGHGKSI